MRGSFCYLPVLKARGGQFNAIRALSPTARSRIAPLIDIPLPSPVQAKDQDAYLAQKIAGITSSWVPDRPLYLDAHDFQVETRISGDTPVGIVSQALHLHGYRVIPVTGTEAERGIEYVREIASVARAVGAGICLRVEREEVDDPTALRQSLARTLDHLLAGSGEVDLLIDMGFVGDDDVANLRSSLLEAIQIASRLYKFRNIATAGGSVPEQLGKKDTGKVRRAARKEIEAWADLQEVLNAPPVAFSDFGIISPRYVKPGRAVNVPARVRYTTYREHIFLRTARSGHGSLCTQMVAMEGYAGPAYSAGDQRIKLASHGLASAGNPSIWVAGDLNHHLELVSAQVWELITRAGLSGRYSLPEPRRYPWLQPELVEY